MPDWVLTDDATVERFRGRNGLGPLFGAPEQWAALFSEKKRVARPADGREVTAPVSVFLAVEATGIPPESRVTIRGRACIVVEVREHIYPDLPTPDHIQLLCT
jgi:hypothetical protein